MNQLMQGVKRFIHDEEGATMIEYALLAALISVVAIVAITGIGGNVNQIYRFVCDVLANTAAGTTSCG